MSRPKKTLYLITTGDELELPIFSGTADECAWFLNMKEHNFRMMVSRMKSGKVKQSKDGFKAFKIEEEPWELTMCDMMCPGPEEE